MKGIVDSFVIFKYMIVYCYNLHVHVLYEHDVIKCMFLFLEDS
jgi:hypothetical protein